MPYIVGCTGAPSFFVLTSKTGVWAEAVSQPASRQSVVNFFILVVLNDVMATKVHKNTEVGKFSRKKMSIMD
jgi:hypothetical protein